MNTEFPELDRMQRVYKEAVEEWVAAIRKEEALASQNHTLAQVDRWEQAHFDEEKARQKAKEVKADYEAALRKKFFDF
jgi:hypothetical protein